MTLIIDSIGIDTDIFTSCTLNERMCMVCFTYSPGNSATDITLPLVFEDRLTTRRFWNAFLKAKMKRWRTYEVRGYEVWFSLELYVRLEKDAKMYRQTTS